MKVAVSIPEDLFDSAESLGKRLGVSRSRLYATALAEFLAKDRGRKTTERLNRVYAKRRAGLRSRYVDSKLGPSVASRGSRARPGLVG
jgi:metal-responsive CopG/Arc/MetJ family transcriptional regulator